jgi:hypothetical protein
MFSSILGESSAHTDIFSDFSAHFVGKLIGNSDSAQISSVLAVLHERRLKSEWLKNSLVIFAFSDCFSGVFAVNIGHDPDDRRFVANASGHGRR